MAVTLTGPWTGGQYVGYNTAMTKKEYQDGLFATRTSAGIRAKQDLDAYLAGFFDGEGHISMRRDPRRPWAVYVEVGATQVCRGPLELLVKAYGGNIIKKAVGKNNVQVCYAWKCGESKNAFWALWRMLPWLIVKRAKARAAVIVLQNRPLNCVGGQISSHQKMAITKALKGFHVIKAEEKRWQGRNQNRVKAALATTMDQISQP